MRTPIKQNLLIAVGTSLMLLTGHACADPSATEKIEANLEQYESRFNRGNAEAVANLFSEDVVYYDPTGQVHH